MTDKIVKCDLCGTPCTGGEVIDVIIIVEYDIGDNEGNGHPRTATILFDVSNTLGDVIDEVNKINKPHNINSMRAVKITVPIKHLKAQEEK